MIIKTIIFLLSLSLFLFVSFLPVCPPPPCGWVYIFLVFLVFVVAGGGLHLCLFKVVVGLPFDSLLRVVMCPVDSSR